MATLSAAENSSGGPLTQHGPTPAEVRAALDRVLHSRCFEQAGRASDFLRFVVEQTLAGRGRNLKGYVIATAVFGRSADFDAQTDPLVRVEAGRLRRRLVEHYATEGSSEPVRIELPRGHYAPEWRYNVTSIHADARIETTRLKQAPSGPSRSHQRTGLVLAVVTLGSAVSALAWHEFAQVRTLTTSAIEAPRTLPIVESDRFPVIVAPFENLSGERELDLWAGAMTEEILLRLNRLEVLVIAAHAPWSGPLGHTGAGDHAGYVLTGSIRATGGKTRLTVRLIKTDSGELLWSKPYNVPHDTGTLPALEERIALEVAAVAAPYGPLYAAELQRAQRAAKTTPDLRDCFAAYYEYRRRPDPEVHANAKVCFQNVTVRRPELANAWAGLALLDIDEYAFYFQRPRESSEATLARAGVLIDRARSLDNDNSLVELARTRLLFFTADHESFVRSAERVLAMDPDNSQNLAVIGILFSTRGDSARGLPLVDRSIELTPNAPGYYEIARALTRLREGRSHEALEAAMSIGAPNWYMTPLLTAAAAGLAREPEIAARARQQLAHVAPDFAADPGARLGRWRFDGELRDAIMRGLKAAGVLTLSTEPVSSGG